MTACIYTLPEADGIAFAADGKALVTAEPYQLSF